MWPAVVCFEQDDIDADGGVGQSGALPPILAAWAPAVSGLMLSLALLLHLEDG